jgi:hypothetical protein
VKYYLSIFVFLNIIKITTGQTITAAGSVKNEEGNPICGAMVSEFRSKTASATYTDSLGFFSFRVGVYSKMNISCNGYNDTLINIAGKKDISIILSKSKNGKHLNNSAGDNTENSLINKNLMQDAVSTQSGVNNNYVYGGGVRNYTGSLLPVFSYKEETKGRRYLFGDWAHGSVVNADNSAFNNPGYVYNYDKMEGALLMTGDKQSAIEVDKAQIKSFTVYVDKDKPSVFENVPSVDNVHFVQVIYSGNKYKIYKLTKTKFVKSDYHTDGIVTTGNSFDEYVDEDSYFVLNVQNNQVQKLSLKKKSVKEAFASEGERLNRFFSENSDNAINELFLKNLGDYLNK